MVFDVSQGSTDRTPLIRPDVKYNQVEPPDRMASSAQRFPAYTGCVCASMSPGVTSAPPRFST